MMRLILLLSLLATSSMLWAQPGCPDSQALNYDMTATSNDGSCIYSATNYALTPITLLPDDLNESSGLAFFGNELWTHNDGGPDEIYRIDQATGESLQTILVANSNNKDWEDLAEDDTYLYIGDFGNNSGDRTNLRAYRVAKDNLGGLIANAEKISFSYSDQVDFTVNENNHDYDCEAFFYHQDSLHFFSKNWVNNKTRHYTIPAIPGTHVAQLRETFDVQGLITAADIGEDGVISLLGYTNVGLNFMWLLYDYQPNHFFSGNKRRIDLGTALTNSQTEGIVFTQDGEGYISSENFNALPPRLLSFTTRQWTGDFVSNTTELSENQMVLNVFPNPFTNQLSIELSSALKEDSELTLYNALGQMIQHSILPQGIQSHTLDIKTDLSKGWYFLQLKDNETIYQQKIMKQ